MRKIILFVVLLVALAGFGVAQGDNIPAAKPEITIEKLQKRLKELEGAREQILANLNAVNGAIEDCKYWMTELEDKEESPVKTNGPN